jgi:hypothetical protein
MNLSVPPTPKVFLVVPLAKEENANEEEEDGDDFRTPNAVARRTGANKHKVVAANIVALFVLLLAEEGGFLICCSCFDIRMENRTMDETEKQIVLSPLRFVPKEYVVFM